MWLFFTKNELPLGEPYVTFKGATSDIDVPYVAAEQAPQGRKVKVGFFTK